MAKLNLYLKLVYTYSNFTIISEMYILGIFSFVDSHITFIFQFPMVGTGVLLCEFRSNFKNRFLVVIKFLQIIHFYF